jgi:methylphosphotriester-DNA--protein-cysteine methyltransferase
VPGSARSGTARRNERRQPVRRSPVDAGPIRSEAKGATEQALARLLDLTQVGYRDPAAFRKLFLQITGMTPSGYGQAFAVR